MKSPLAMVVDAVGLIAASVFAIMGSVALYLGIGTALTEGDETGMVSGGIGAGVIFFGLAYGSIVLASAIVEKMQGGGDPEDENP